MRIAQVSPLYERVPPIGYGGTERVVGYLTEELVRLGHDVTLFATADSLTSARLVPVWPHALRREPTTQDELAPHVLMLEHVGQMSDDFDLIHFHTDYIHYSSARRIACPSVTTLHGRLDVPELAALYREFSDVPVVSISDAQREPLPHAGWAGTVPHGLPPEVFPFQERPGDYLAFLGRISREKRVDRAIEIARRVGWPIRIAAKIGRSDRAYFEAEIAPLFELPFVEYLGELEGPATAALLGGARVLLFPIDWREPFGLVMIEAMACGTPVVAFRGGSVEEVITEGVTGFVVDSIEAAADATRRAASLDRGRCRREFERRFSAGRMALDYVAIYHAMLETKRAGRTRQASRQSLHGR